MARPEQVLERVWTKVWRYLGASKEASRPKGTAHGQVSKVGLD